MSPYRTEQEEFWAGNFGDEYVSRNRSSRLIASNIRLFSQALARTQAISSVLDLGANIGLNLLAIRQLLPDVECAAVEINQSAVEELRKLDDIDVYPTSLLEFQPSRQWDLVLIKGVLIHVNPNELDLVYGLLYASSRRYICIAEYYNPTPVGITYRGHQNRLFKRDFAGEMLDRYQDLAIVDYGFAYHRDRSWPQDDITWFLLQRT